jgi:hypothetical protein
MARMTHHTLLVLRALMSPPGREMYGLEFARAFGVSGGTVYPMLYYAERVGWLTGRDEQGTARAKQRRLRRYYQVTDAGIAAAVEEMSREVAMHAALGISPPLTVSVGGAAVGLTVDERQPPGALTVISGDEDSVSMGIARLGYEDSQ